MGIKMKKGINKPEEVTYESEEGAIKKKWNFAICNNMDGSGRRCAKWNKSDRERQILYNLTDMWNLKTKQTETEQTGGCQREGVAGISEIDKGD